MARIGRKGFWNVKWINEADTRHGITIEFSRSKYFSQRKMNSEQRTRDAKLWKWIWRILTILLFCIHNKAITKGKIVFSFNPYKIHILLFKWTLNGGVQMKKKEKRFLPLVPSSSYGWNQSWFLTDPTSFIYIYHIFVFSLIFVHIRQRLPFTVYRLFIRLLFKTIKISNDNFHSNAKSFV